jgi:hypothetical protein
MERRSVVRQEAAVSADEMRRSLAAPLAAAVDGVGTVPFGRLSFRGEARRSLAVDFKANHPEVYNAILHDAEDAMAHRFDLLGSGPTQLGPTIDWSRDFKSGFRWPRGYV